MCGCMLGSGVVAHGVTGTPRIGEVISLLAVCSDSPLFPSSGASTEQ